MANVDMSSEEQVENIYNTDEQNNSEKQRYSQIIRKVRSLIIIGIKVILECVLGFIGGFIIYRYHEIGHTFGGILIVMSIILITLNIIKILKIIKAIKQF